MSTIFTPATNFQGPGSTYDTTYGAFGLTVYKQFETQLSRNVYLSEHLCYDGGSYIEMCAGAHYYAHGAYNSTYQKARVTIPFSDIELYTANRRVGCVSMSVAGVGVVDFGIENLDDGLGWFAFYYSHSASVSSGKHYAPSNATSVTITLTPVRENGKDKVLAEYAWSNGTTTPLEIEVSSGALFNVDSAGRPLVRFCRFMSLIPQDHIPRTPANDYNDGSYMRNAKFTSPQLCRYSDSAWVTWGTDKLDYIWSVQGWNITQCSVGNTDTFSLTHSHNVYA